MDVGNTANTSHTFLQNMVSVNSQEFFVAQ